MKLCLCGQPATRLCTFTVRRLDSDGPPDEYEGALCERHFEMIRSHGDDMAQTIMADAVAQICVPQARPPSKS